MKFLNILLTYILVNIIFIPFSEFSENNIIFYFGIFLTILQNVVGFVKIYDIIESKLSDNEETE